jgi:hypothetical protein
MRIKSVFPAFAAVLVLVLTNSIARATTYNILNQGNGILLSGTITTDGHLGALTAADITAWNIIQTGISGSNLPTSIDNTNSALSYSGGALSATNTALVFNFTLSTASVLSFTSNQTFHVLSQTLPAFQLTYCDAKAACIPPFGFGSADVILVLSSAAGADIPSRPTGTSPIATVPGPTVGAGASSFVLAALFLGWLARRRGDQMV